MSTVLPNLIHITRPSRFSLWTRGGEQRGRGQHIQLVHRSTTTPLSSTRTTVTSSATSAGLPLVVVARSSSSKGLEPVYNVSYSVAASRQHMTASVNINLGIRRRRPAQGGGGGAAVGRGGRSRTSTNIFNAATSEEDEHRGLQQQQEDGNWRSDGRVDGGG